MPKPATHTAGIGRKDGTNIATAVSAHPVAAACRYHCRLSTASASNGCKPKARRLYAAARAAKAPASPWWDANHPNRSAAHAASMAACALP